jgi:hypothetical protein
MSTVKDNKKMIYIALSKHLASQNHERLSKIQSKLFDTSEKQNLKKLKYDDNVIHRRTHLFVMDQIIENSSSMSLSVLLSHKAIWKNPIPLQR